MLDSQRALSHSSAPTPTKKRGVPSTLSRGLAILSAFQYGDSALSNKQLCQRTNLPKGTVSRLTSALITLGYMTRRYDGRFELSPSLMTLAYPALCQISIPETVTSLLFSLSRMGPFVAGIAILNKTDIVYISVMDSSSCLRPKINVGARMRAINCAAGHALFYSLPNHQKQYLLRSIEVENLVTAKAQFRQGQKQVDRHGFCSVANDWCGDMASVATPLKTTHGESMAICCSVAQLDDKYYNLLTQKAGPTIAKFSLMIKDQLR